jgi:hypothetical protein
MTPVHLKVVFAGKIALVATTFVAAAFVASDPTVKVAIIAGVSLVLANVPMFILGMLTRRDTKQGLRNQEEQKVGIAEIKQNTDGVLAKLTSDKDKQGLELADKSDQLSRAQGHREGTESERERVKE